MKRPFSSDSFGQRHAKLARDAIDQCLHGGYALLECVQGKKMCFALEINNCDNSFTQLHLFYASIIIVMRGKTIWQYLAETEKFIDGSM